MTKNGEKHFSVGAVLRQNGKYLLINRAVYPPGHACPAGHIDINESPADALRREVKEETGLEAKNLKLIFHETLDWNECSHAVRIHEWFVYECDFEGTLELSRAEAKGGGWYTPAEIKKLRLERVWQYWLGKMRVI